MTSAEFVARIQRVVYESSIEGTVRLLQAPPGRQPGAGLVDLSKWFAQLLPADRERVQRIIQLAVRAAVFEMLTVLDGVLSIRGAGEEPGYLELRHTVGAESVLLNDPAGELLHDLFAERVPPT